MRTAIQTIVFFTLLCLFFAPLTLFAKTVMNGTVRLRGEVLAAVPPFSSSGGSSDFMGTRARLSVTGEPVEKLKVFIQPQYAGKWGIYSSSIGGASGGTSDPYFSLHQGWFEWFMSESLSFKGGRQEFSFGSERLVGAADYNHFGRSFDGFRFDYFYRLIQATLFYSKINDQSSGAAGELGDDHHFAGFYLTGQWDWWDRADLYILENLNFVGVGTNPLVWNTLGLRIQNQMARFFTEGEVSFQFGKIDGVSRNAIQADLEIGIELQRSQKWQLSIQGNYASEYFQQLFPSGHKFFGFMDFFGRKNVMSGVFHHSIAIKKNWSWLVDFHSFWRVSSTSALTNLTASTDVSPGDLGATAQFVGTELNVLTKINWNFLSVVVGYGGFNPGSYFKSSQGKKAWIHFGWISLEAFF